MTARKKAAVVEVIPEEVPQVARFWMIYGIGQGAPRHTHVTKGSAVSEAGRLAEQSPGIRFVVLQAVEAYCAAVSPVKRLKVVPAPEPVRMADDDIPF